MKFAYALIPIFLLCLSYAALLQYPESITKGEQLSILGPCENDFITIKAKLYDYTLFSQKIQCKNNSFTFNKKISYTFPSGMWTFSAGKYVFKIKVNPSKESKYLLIKLLSPSKEVERASTITLSLEITDAGKKVSDANVFVFLPTGKIAELHLAEEGIYSAEVFLPHSIPLKPWRLLATAVRPCSYCSQKISGGEQEFTIAIKKAKIILNILEPKVTTFPLEKDHSIIVKAYYASGTPLENPKIKMVINNKTFQFKQESATIFKSVFNISNIEGSAAVKILAYDDANNFAELKTNFIFIKDISWYLKHLFPLLVFYAALLFVLLIILVSAIKFLRKKISTKSKLKLLESQLKELQQKYYNGKISKSAYRESALALEREIAKLKKEL